MGHHLRLTACLLTALLIVRGSTKRTRFQYRPVAYLNDILEQDHRAIKKRICAKHHFRRFDCARRTIQGYETIYKGRKGQVRWLRKRDVRAENEFIDRLFGLMA